MRGWWISISVFYQSSHLPIKSFGIYISTTRMFMINTFARVLAYHEGLSSVKSHNFLVMWYCEIMWQTRANCISTTTMSMVLKPGKVVACRKRLSPINSNDPLVTWYCEIKLETKFIISLLQQNLSLSKLAWCWLTLTNSYPWRHITFNHMVLWDHVNSNKQWISTTKNTTATTYFIRCKNIKFVTL